MSWACYPAGWPPYMGVYYCIPCGQAETSPVKVSRHIIYVGDGACCIGCYCCYIGCWGIIGFCIGYYIGCCCIGCCYCMPPGPTGYCGVF